LAQLSLEQANARGSKQVGRFAEEALDALAAYPWRRNLDELDEIVRQAHANAQGPQVTLDDLPPRIRLAADAAAHPRPPVETIVLEEFLADIERELIERALAQAKGNKTQAAQLLGLTRPRLYRRLVQLGLAGDEADPVPEPPPLEAPPHKPADDAE
jgi:DNA-binding NtrC family response regulator